jgi:hypothetical protein
MSLHLRDTHLSLAAAYSWLFQHGEHGAHHIAGRAPEIDPKCPTESGIAVVNVCGWIDPPNTFMFLLALRDRNVFERVASQTASSQGTCIILK